MGAAIKFRTAEVPRQAAETGRLKIIQGPDKGAIFVIRGAKASVGRGEENDIVIADLKASRRHAELEFINQSWNVRDLGSANGIAVNGKVSRGSVIRTSDVLTVGETMMEFVSAEAGTMLLKAVRTPEEIELEQSAFRAQQNRVRQLAQIGGPRNSPATIAGGVAGPATQAARNPKLPLMIAAVGIMAFVFFGNNDSRVPMAHKSDPSATLAAYLPPEVPLSKAAEVFFKEGFREYRERNYLRARTQFETAKQIAPGNSLVQLYLDDCNQAINDEVKFDLDTGKKDYDSGDLKDAKLHYESVMRLLYRDQSNPSFKEAQDQLTVVTQEMSEGQ